MVTNDTTNQSRARTTVYYERGHRADALGVASCLHIGSDASCRWTPTHARSPTAPTWRDLRRRRPRAVAQSFSTSTAPVDIGCTLRW